MSSHLQATIVSPGRWPRIFGYSAGSGKPLRLHSRPLRHARRRDPGSTGGATRTRSSRRRMSTSSSFFLDLDTVKEEVSCRRYRPVATVAVADNRPARVTEIAGIIANLKHQRTADLSAHSLSTRLAGFVVPKDKDLGSRSTIACALRRSPLPPRSGRTCLRLPSKCTSHLA